MLSLNPADESIQAGPTTIRFLSTGADSGGSIAVFEFMVSAGKRLLAPAHSHDAYEETIYGLEGVITFTVDGIPIDIGPGQSLCIPRCAVHRFDNNGSVNMKDARLHQLSWGRSSSVRRQQSTPKLQLVRQIA